MTRRTVGTAGMRRTGEFYSIAGGLTATEPQASSTAVGHLEQALAELTRIFRAAPDKRSAHERSRPLLEALSAEPGFLRETLARHLKKPGALDSQNYPVVSIEIDTNPYFVLIANAWIPLPDHRTDLSTKAIHHHGSMLLSTANMFGPGYEHWVFTRPEKLDDARYRMKVISTAQHALHTVAFVDAWVPHLPVYPAELTITLALWSSEHAISWKDRVKRLPFLKGNEKRLRHVASRLGLARALELKVVENFDYYPTGRGFRNIEDRLEFALGPNEDHLHSLFHVIQKTGNDGLAPLIEQRLSEGLASADTVRSLLSDLKSGRSIEGRLSDGHYTVPYANFSTRDIEQSVALAAAE